MGPIEISDGVLDAVDAGDLSAFASKVPESFCAVCGEMVEDAPAAIVAFEMGDRLDLRTTHQSCEQSRVFDFESSGQNGFPPMQSFTVIRDKRPSGAFLVWDDVFWKPGEKIAARLREILGACGFEPIATQEAFEELQDAPAEPEINVSLREDSLSLLIGKRQELQGFPMRDPAWAERARADGRCVVLFGRMRLLAGVDWKRIESKLARGAVVGAAVSILD